MEIETGSTHSHTNPSPGPVTEIVAPVAKTRFHSKNRIAEESFDDAKLSGTRHITGTVAAHSLDRRRNQRDLFALARFPLVQSQVSVRTHK
jgi:hypothetical protein